MDLECFIKIYGQVHGVGFRYDAQKTAVGLNLTGWVKNTVDGTVEILIQGEKSNLEQFIHWAEHGPDSADVENVEVDWRPTTQIFGNFGIL